MMKGETHVDWETAETHLNDFAEKCLNKGSVGITEFFEKGHYIFQRFQAGERSTELYTAIMELK